MSIFITSDTHFGHDREFIWRPRGFNSVEEMNEGLIYNWNKVVSPNDTVFHLGDIMLGDDNQGIENLKRLNGHINIVAGNHDTNRRILFYLENGFDSIHHAVRITYKGYTFYLSHFPTLTANLEVESMKQTTLNLFGHTHQKTNFYMDNPYMYHVGVDSHNNTPVLLDDIIVDIKNKMQECALYL